MANKQFLKRNESFSCFHCGLEIEPHPSSSRDHCNYCLWGQHVDIFPGDRKNECKGQLKPIGLQTTNGKTKIIYRCQSCQQLIKNVAAPDDDKKTLSTLAQLVWHD